MGGWTHAHAQVGAEADTDWLSCVSYLAGRALRIACRIKTVPRESGTRVKVPCILMAATVTSQIGSNQGQNQMV